MNKKYIKPEIKTIKIDSEPCMNITSQHKEGEYPVCDCNRQDADTSIFQGKNPGIVTIPDNPKK